MERSSSTFNNRINIVRMAILQKVICRVNEVPIKIATQFFTDLEKSISQPRIAKMILNNKRIHAGGVTIPVFKLYYRATAIKRTWCCHETRHQCNLIDDPDINSHTHGLLIFDKEVRKRKHLQQMVQVKLGI